MSMDPNWPWGDNSEQKKYTNTYVPMHMPQLYNPIVINPYNKLLVFGGGDFSFPLSLFSTTRNPFSMDVSYKEWHGYNNWYLVDNTNANCNELSKRGIRIFDEIDAFSDSTWVGKFSFKLLLFNFAYFRIFCRFCTHRLSNRYDKVFFAFPRVSPKLAPRKYCTGDDIRQINKNFFSKVFEKLSCTCHTKKIGSPAHFRIGIQCFEDP